MEVHRIKLNSIKDSKNCNFLSNEDVMHIVEKYTNCKLVKIVGFELRKASDKMMGFLAEYWKLRVDVALDNGPQQIHFFIKSVARSNAGKAAMVNDLKLFDKEALFYTVIKPQIDIEGSKRWSARVAVVFENDLVLEDLTALGYRTRDKLEKFDLEHCKRALETLAIFHSKTIIFEEKKRKSGHKYYTVAEDFQKLLDKGGYTGSDPWFNQCMDGALEALKAFSKYGKTHKHFKIIEREWRDIWLSAFDLDDCGMARNVICHRDLWNNNLLYHYNVGGVPDGCALVDFQAVHIQPPAGDVMLLIYCSNMDPRTRERILPSLLRHYHSYLSQILESFDIAADDVLILDDFLKSAEEQRKWGLIVSACLFPQMWMDDDKVTAIFGDPKRFEEILTKKKGSFIKEMIAESEDYKEKVLGIFEEIVWRYILGGGDEIMKNLDGLSSTMHP